MENLVLFDVGIRNENGNYHNIVTCNTAKDAHKQAQELLDMVVHGTTIIIHEKHYRLICTTPHLVSLV